MQPLKSVVYKVRYLSGMFCVFMGLIVTSLPVHANAQCWINGSMNLDFGSVDIRMDDFIHSNLNYTCLAPYDPTGDVYHIRVCAFVQPDELGTTNPRSLRRWDNTVLRYNLFSDVSRTLLVGPVNGDTPPYSWLVNVSPNSQYSSQFTLYGKIPGRQPGLSSGTYESHYNGGVLRWRWSKGNMPSPTIADCQSNTGGSGGGAVTFFISVTSSVLDSCLITSASDMDFGTVNSNIARNIDKSSMITLSCPQGIPWALSLDGGVNLSGGQRRMVNSRGDYITYSLFRDSARTQLWNAGTILSGTGQGQTSSAQVPVYGRVSSHPTLPAGIFNDHVIVTLTY